MIKVMVVDDQDLVRDGISMILDGQPEVRRKLGGPRGRLGVVTGGLLLLPPC